MSLPVRTGESHGGSKPGRRQFELRLLEASGADRGEVGGGWCLSPREENWELYLSFCLLSSSGDSQG